MPFDTVHPVGDYSFRRVPSVSKPTDLEIHQLKYPTAGANRDLNVIFPIERLQELVAEGFVGSLTKKEAAQLEEEIRLQHQIDPDLWR